MGFFRLKRKQTNEQTNKKTQKTLQLLTEKEFCFVLKMSEDICFWNRVFWILESFSGLVSHGKQILTSAFFFFFLIRRKKLYNQVVYWMFNASFKISAEKSPVFFSFWLYLCSLNYIMRYILHVVIFFCPCRTRNWKPNRNLSRSLRGKKQNI